MAYSVEEIARQAVAELGLDSGYELGAQFVGQRYAELCGRAKFRHLRKYGQKYLPAPIESGACTVTLDSPIVTLDSTALAACETNAFFQWPEGFTGMFFRPQIAQTWYRIAYAETNGNIILETPFSQDNGFILLPDQQTVSGVSLYIIPRYASLDANARQFGVFVFDFMYRAMQLISEDELNLRAPNRFQVWAYPEYVAELSNDPNATGLPKLVEIYPYPLQSLTMHYTYWDTPKILQWGDYVPPTIDPDILRAGAMADLCSNMSGKSIRAGNLEMAGYWRNLRNQQDAEFNKKVNQAIRNDRGADDLALRLMRSGWKPPLDWDPIKDAYSNFLARGY